MTRALAPISCGPSLARSKTEEYSQGECTLALKEFLQELDDEVAIVMGGDFDIEVIETQLVPNFDDPSITFHNLDTKKKKCKLLESCVLYVDIRRSAQISASKQTKTLAKMYSSFVTTMIDCARYYGGHVRNIIGDRVMVVFDTEDCFKKAVDTATLMNTVSQYILNKRIKSIDFKCGIGIDYGKMLITKSGAIRYGAEKEFYRGLVWLGNPANVASRLTDLAYKTEEWTTPTVDEGHFYPLTHQFSWIDRSYEEFLDSLATTGTRTLQHKNQYFFSFIKSSTNHSRTHQPILITEAVYDGLSKAHPKSDYIASNYFKKQLLDVRDYDGAVYGGDVTYTVAKEL
jgi:adenylate cyclase